MGLGRLLNRSTVYTATDTVTNASQTFTIVNGLAPQFSSAGNYMNGMTIPGAWRASLLLSGLLAQVPWNGYRAPVGGVPELISPRPPLLEQPNPPETRMTTFRSMMLDRIWHGNAVAVIAARSSTGWPTAIFPVPATAVAVRRVTPWIDSPLPIGALEYAIGTERYGSQDVIHVKGPCPPGWVRGMGVLETQLTTLNLARALQDQAGAVANHGVPTGVITSDNPDLTPTEAAEIKQDWNAAQATRGVAVLNSATHFQPLSWNPEEMELVEARRMSLSELELVFGLPPGWLGGMNSARQYSNIEQDAVQLLKFSLGDYLAEFEQALSLAMPRTTVARAELDAILRSDTLSRYQAYAIALSNGFLDVDEVRALEHRQPLNKGEGAEGATVERVAQAAHQLATSVDVSISADEVRELLNRAGAELTGPAPEKPPPPPQLAVTAGAPTVAPGGAAGAKMNGQTPNGQAPNGKMMMMMGADQ
jgi:HK97 family phage portal protein